MFEYAVRSAKKKTFILRSMKKIWAEAESRHVNNTR